MWMVVVRCFKEWNKMEKTITKTEYTLLKYLQLSLQPSAKSDILPSPEAEDWEQLLSLANRHEVLPLLGYVLDTSRLPEKQKLILELKTAKTVHQWIQLQALNERLTEILKNGGIRAITLKGCTAARFYPVPEFRKTSDIDLFVADGEEAERAIRILYENGFRPSGDWHANHHVILISERQETVELHRAWNDEFKEKRLNRTLEKFQKESDQHCRLLDVQGCKVYAYETAWQGFYLLIHMLQHFVGSGFGLRNLCDWVVLWENCDEEEVRSDFWEMVCVSGTKEFAKAVTAICVKYLGLEQKKSPVPADERIEPEVRNALLRDILDAGEFGYSEAERMVGMDGNSLFAYVREFHHQMHINFPKAGKILFFWPVLWIVTLFRFFYNNRKLNRAPISSIMKKAGKRGRLVRRLMSQEK